MPFLRILFLFVFLVLTVLLLIFSILPESLAVIASWAFVLLVIISIAFADKFLLTLLGARESLDVDKSAFFQRVKSFSFQLGLPNPKVYTYRGNVVRIFTLNSFTGPSLVMEEGMMEKLSYEELDAIICYMLLMLKIGGSRRRTFSYFLSCLSLKFLYSFKSLMDKIFRNKTTSKPLAFIMGVTLRPFLESVLKSSYSRREVKKLGYLLGEHFSDLDELGSAITKLSYRNFNKDLLENTLLNSFLNDNGSGKYIDIFETFPVLETYITSYSKI